MRGGRVSRPGGWVRPLGGHAGMAAAPLKGLGKTRLASKTCVDFYEVTLCLRDRRSCMGGRHLRHDY